MSQTKEEKYLEKIFYLLHIQDNIRFTDKKGFFNQTELRLLGEIVSAKNRGERYISTQLAKRLGITRSAISQVVKGLEKKGVVQRVPDEVDRKIAYVEISENVLEEYDEQLRRTSSSVYNVIESYGEARFDKLCEELEAFFNVAESKLKERK